VTTNDALASEIEITHRHSHAVLWSCRALSDRHRATATRLTADDVRPAAAWRSGICKTT